MDSRELSQAEIDHTLEQNYDFWRKFFAAIGAIFIGITLPTFLVCWSFGSDDIYGSLPKPDGASIRAESPIFIQNLIRLEFAATFFCGPGAWVLALWLYRRCERRVPSAAIAKHIQKSAIEGAILAFLNLPAYLVMLVIGNQAFAALKVPLLIAIAGASSGAWIAWQAWRSVHPEEKFWPRFSLGTLMIVVLAWGALLAVFAPK